MKKLIVCLLCLSLFKSYATTWNVTVSNFQFSPSTLNVTTGDIIHFVWSSGSHTTTSLGIPAGATAWSSGIDAVTTTFNYTPTIAGVYHYQCNIHAALMQASFTVSSPLPVVLSAFNISSLNGKPDLSWTTTSEVNTDHFSIQKSTDGNTFTEIGRIAAGGNSAVARNYTYSDVSAQPNLRYAYYYLGVVDKDGNMHLSPIKLYKNITGGRKLIVSLSPNPVTSMGHLMLQFNADKAGIMTARLFDVQGRLLLTTELSAEAGLNNGHIHLGGIPPGNYTIRFTLNDVNESYKISKQ